MLTCRVPYALVQHASWQALFHYLNPKVHVHSRQTLARDIKDLHQQLQACASSAFDAADTKCSIQTDVWTAAGGQLSFSGGNISWVDKDWRLHTDFAFLIPLRERHTGVNLAHHLHTWVQSRNLGGRIVSIATDNASNNSTMLERFSQSKGVSFRPADSRVYCACHCIGRIVHAFMKALGCRITAPRTPPLSVPELRLNDDTLDSSLPQAQDGDVLQDRRSNEEEEDEECQSESDGEDPTTVSASAHGTSAAMARKFCRVTMRSSFHVAQFKKLSKGGRALKRVAGIRWANDVEVWESVIEHQQAVFSMLVDHRTHYSKHKISLTPEDFNNLIRLTTVLGRLRDLTRKMEANKPTGALVLDMWLHLFEHLNKVRRDYDQEAPDLVKAIDAAISKAEFYRAKALKCPPILLATALHPSGRLQFFRVNEELGVPATYVHSLLLEVCEEITAGTEDPPVSPIEALPDGETSKFLSYDSSGEIGKSTKVALHFEIEYYDKLHGTSHGSEQFSCDPLRG